MGTQDPINNHHSHTPKSHRPISVESGEQDLHFTIPLTSPPAQPLHLNLRPNTLYTVGIKEKSSPVSDTAYKWKTLFTQEGLQDRGRATVVGAKIIPEYLLVTN